MALTINGIHDSQIPNMEVYVNNIAPVPNVERDYVWVNGEMVLRKSNVQGRQINLAVSVDADERKIFYKNVADVSNWLYTLGKVKIQLDDDDRYYLGIIEGADSFDNIFRQVATGNVSVLCDGYRYRDVIVELAGGVQKSFDNLGYGTLPYFTGNITTSFTLTINSVSITVNGTGALVLDLEGETATVGGVYTNNVSGDIPKIIKGANIAVANATGTMSYRERVI